MQRADDWPLVGRQAELSQLVGTFDGGSGVVISGGAGVGKTRLASECLEEARRRGFTTLRVSATLSTADVPFGAFAALLPEFDPGLDRAELIRRIADGVSGRSGGAPMALLVDDAHLLDDGEAAVTHQLVAGHGIFVIVTVRTGEPTRDAVMRLWKDQLAARIDLAPLSESHVHDLLVEVLGAPLEGLAVRRLHELSGGNVLYLRELVLGALAGRTLRFEGDLWRLENLGAADVSARLTELVESNLLRLTRQERLGVEYIAFGEPLDADVFDRLTGGKVDVNGLETQRLIRSQLAGNRIELSLAHPVYGEVLRRQASDLKARGLVRELADEYSALDPATVSEHALRLGVWRLQGGGQRDPGTLLAAAQRAIVLHDFTLAEKLARAATEAGGGFESALAEAQLLMWTGRAEEAEAKFAALAPSATSDRDLALLTVGRVDNLFYNLGRWSDALSLAEETEQLISDPQWSSEFLAYRVSVLDMGAGEASDVSSLHEIIEREEGRAFPWACAMAGWKAARAGQLSLALDLTERGMRAHQSIIWPPLPWGAATPAVLQGFALAFAGEFGRSRRLAQDIYAQAVERGDLEAVSIAATNLVMTDVGEGRLTSARRWGQEAVSTARRCGRVMAMRVSLVYLAEALAIGGAPDSAEQVLDELHGPRLGQLALLDAEATRVRAWVHVCRDHDETRGVALLRDAARIAVRTQDWVFESAALHDMARLGCSGEVVNRIAELAATVEGPLIQARLAHTRALLANDPVELSRAADQFEEISAGLLAAEAAGQAAVAWHGRDPRRAKAADLRAADLSDRCPGASTPGIRLGSRVRAALTDRQLLVARLAADGVSNKEIAQRLTISVRTVENKLYECYSRLGITRRNELSGALAVLEPLRGHDLRRS